MNINRLKWAERFYSLALEVATWSKDPKAKVGAVLVSPCTRQFSFGYNGFPQGIKDSETRLEDTETKLALTVHAELNAILNARTNLTGWSLVTTKAPCLDCAKAIVQAGIREVICPPIKETLSNWGSSQAKAFELLNEANIMITIIEEEE
tara:strand:- start:4273 stop:4722 length:450 start_codon:yes stop_codon:yes gene_type:complete